MNRGSQILLTGLFALFLMGGYLHFASQREAEPQAMANARPEGLGLDSWRVGEEIESAGVPLVEPVKRRSPVGPLEYGLENGETYLKSGNCREALIAYRKTYYDTGMNPTAKRHLVEALVSCGNRSLKGGLANRAIAFYEEALELRPSQTDALLGMGKALARIGRVIEGVEFIKQYLAYLPGDEKTHHFLGSLYYKLGRLERAEHHLLQGKEIPAGARRLLDLTRKRLAVESEFWTTESAHFRIKYDAARYHDFAVAVLNVLEEAYRQVGDRLGYFPRESQVIVLYTREAFTDITRTPEWTGAVFDGEIRLPVGGLDSDSQIDRVSRMLYHEYTHVAVYQMAGGRCPTWINEGIAQMVESGFQEIPWESKGQPIPVEDLMRSFLRIKNTERAMAAYRQSRDMTALLMEEYGMKYLQDFLYGLRDPIGAKRVFREVFRTDMEDFYGHWRQIRYPE